MYIDNNTNEVFNLNLDGNTYTASENSLRQVGIVQCVPGNAAVDGLCSKFILTY